MTEFVTVLLGFGKSIRFDRVVEWLRTRGRERGIGLE